MTRAVAIFAVVAPLMLPAGAWAAEGEGSESGNLATDEKAFGDIQARTSGTPVLLCQPARFSQYDVRFGWWGMKALDVFTSSTFTPSLDQPINYHKSTAGMKSVWRPRGGGFALGGLAIAGGYEYCDLERQNAIFTSNDGSITLDDSRTITHGCQIGPGYRWSPQLDTYLRYKFQNAVQPLTTRA